jgi:hypothetical protein
VRPSPRAYAISVEASQVVVSHFVRQPQFNCSHGFNGAPLTSLAQARRPQASARQVSRLARSLCIWTTRLL